MPNNLKEFFVMKETLQQPNLLRNKVAKFVGKLAAGTTASALAFGAGGCSAKESYLVELSIGVRCSESVDGGGKPAVERYVNNINGSGKDAVLVACHTPEALMPYTDSRQTDAEPVGDPQLKTVKDEGKPYDTQISLDALHETKKSYDVVVPIKSEKGDATSIPQLDSVVTGAYAEGDGMSGGFWVIVVDEKGQYTLKTEALPEGMYVQDGNSWVKPDRTTEDGGELLIPGSRR
jgi:hypothetical protein